MKEKHFNFGFVEVNSVDAGPQIFVGVNKKSGNTNGMKATHLIQVSVITQLHK